MAAAPKFDSPNVMPSGKPLRYIQVDTNADMFGAGIGRAISGFGSTVASVGAQLEANNEKIRLESAKTSANQAFVTASMASNELEATYLQTQGTNAAAGYTDYSDKLKSIRQEALDSLADDDAKKLFDGAFQPTMLSGANSGAVHAAQQGRVAAIDASKARVNTIMTDSATKFMDEDLFQSNMTALDTQLQEQGRLLGWGPDVLLAEVKQQHSLAWEARITSMAMTDPRGAMQLFARVKDDMNVENRLRVQSGVVATAQNLAIQGTREEIRGGVNGDVRPAFQEGIISGGRREDVDQFLISRAPGKDESHIRNMHPDTAARLSALIQSAPPGIREGITIFSGARSLEHQAELYRRSGGSGMVAKPSPHAPHVRGDAADLGWKGGSFKSMPADAQKWLHDNAGEFGLVFRLGNEPWHIERAAGPRATPQAMQQGSFVNRILAAEGGGAGVYSPAGAAGLMQVMPGTARDVALSLGIPYDPHRLANEDQYNLLIGTTYLNQMLNKFGGDEMLAAAAYNAGPGAVEDWIAKFGDPRLGQISHEEFALRIPFAETRGYVAKVMNASGPQPRNAPVTAMMPKDQFTALVDEKRAWAQANFPGDVQFENTLISGMEQEYNDLIAAHNAELAANYDEILGLVIPIGEEGSYVTQADFQAALQSNPALAAQWENLEATKQNTILNQLRKNDKLNNGTETDAVNEINLSEYDRLRGMWADPQGNVEFQKQDIANNANLTNGQKKTLIDLKTQKPPGSTAVTQPDIDMSKALQLAGPALAAIPLDAKEDPEKYYQFTGALARSLDEQTQLNGGKPLSEVQMLGVIQSLLMKSTTSVDVGPSILGMPLLWRSTTEEFAFEQGRVGQSFPGAEVAPILVPTIPSDKRQQIINAYTAKTGQPPTEAVVNQLYFQWRKNQTAVPSTPPAEVTPSKPKAVSPPPIKMGSWPTENGRVETGHKIIVPGKKGAKDKVFTVIKGNGLDRWAVEDDKGEMRLMDKTWLDALIERSDARIEMDK